MNARAHEFLKGLLVLASMLPVANLRLAKLRNSKYGNEEDLRTMLEQFEKSAKPTFKDATDRSFMRFGSTRDKDLDYGIRGGQIAMEGYVYIVSHHGVMVEPLNLPATALLQ